MEEVFRKCWCSMQNGGVESLLGGVEEDLVIEKQRELWERNSGML